MIEKYLILFIVILILISTTEWFIHKYIMHGIAWFLHQDHHNKKIERFFERNDYFFVIFALPGITGLAIGMYLDYNFLYWIGLGITFYGAAYFLVHDIFIHQRFDFFRNTDSVYLRAIRKAHKMHHKHLGKEDGESFGMLWVSFRYFKEAFNAKSK